MNVEERYHHGDLPNALRAAAVEVIAEKGVGAFSLREVARRAGVSHAAPAHHFGDTRGLLTSVAIEGFDTLLGAMTEAQIGLTDPEDRLVAVGRAYVSVGLEHPAHCSVMFRKDLVDADSAAYQQVAVSAFMVLEDAISELKEQRKADFDVSDAANLCWATMQGLIEIREGIAKMAWLRHGMEVDPTDVDGLVGRLIRLMLIGLLPR